LRDPKQLQAYVAFQSRDFRFLAASNFFSILGIQMLAVAVSWDLYLASHSALVLGNVGLVQVAPFFIFALVAGHFADRYDRRRILLVTQSMGLLTALVLTFSGLSVAVIYTCLFFNATARAFQGPARLSMLTQMVPVEHVSNAVAWNSSVQELASVGGPALAGVLLAASGSKVVYALQGFCALVVLVCYAAMRFRPKPAEAASANPTPMSEGLRQLFRDKLLLSASSLDMFAVLFGGATALLPIFSVEILHGGVHTLGWLRAAPSIGAVAMALTLAHLPRIERAGAALLWAVGGYGAATIVFGLSHSVWLSFAMLLLTGACDNISVVLRMSLLQIETPEWVRGRVMAVNSIFISSSNQLGAVESGMTAAWFGAVGSVVGGGIATLLIVGTFGTFAKRLRSWRQRVY
jgi:MFS family permease